MNLKNSGDSTGFEPMTSAMPVQCSNQLSYEVTQLRAGQFVGLMFSRERLSHLNFSGSWDNCLNCPASARIISSVDFKHRTSYNPSFEPDCFYVFFLFCFVLFCFSSSCHGVLLRAENSVIVFDSVVETSSRQRTVGHLTKTGESQPKLIGLRY